MAFRGKLLSFGGVVQTFGLWKKPYRQNVGTCPVTRNFFIHVSNNEFGSPLTAITIGSSYFSAPKNINTFSPAMISASHELSNHTRLNLGYCFSTAVLEVQKLILWCSLRSSPGAQLASETATRLGDGSFRMVSPLRLPQEIHGYTCLPLCQKEPDELPPCPPSCGWTNPFENKIAVVKLHHFPQVRGENTKTDTT